MNAHDILNYGHHFLIKTWQGLPESEWETAGVCGVWSVKDIILHLASYEDLLVDILSAQLDFHISTPTLNHFLTDYQGFNDDEVAARRHLSQQDALNAYTVGFERTLELIKQVALDQQHRVGLLEWYGADYDLEDFLVYTYYGHKREHGAQIEAFKDRLTG